MDHPDQLEEVLIFSDGSLAFTGFLIYFVIREESRKVMKLVRCGSKTQNCSVPVSKLVSRILGVDGLYSILSVLHAHFSSFPVEFTFVTDSLCTTKLFRQGISTTVKLGSNTQLQVEHAIQMSNSFQQGRVNFIWLPSALNIADCMTKVSRDPVKLVNSAFYRAGELGNGAASPTSTTTRI